MNIWALEKDESIKVLLLLLSNELGENRFSLLNNERLHPCAVRIHKISEPLLTAYVYTYGQNEGEYGVHLEFPQGREADLISNADIYEGLTFEGLSELIRLHLDLVIPELSH